MDYLTPLKRHKQKKNIFLLSYYLMALSLFYFSGFIPNPHMYDMYEITRDSLPTRSFLGKRQSKQQN